MIAEISFEKLFQVLLEVALFLVITHCSLTFLYFSSSFFHLLVHCFPGTFTDEVKSIFSAILCQAMFLQTLPFANRSSFSRHSEINNFVLFDNQVSNFVSSPSSSGKKKNNISLRA